MSDVCRFVVRQLLAVNIHGRRKKNLLLFFDRPGVTNYYPLPSCNSSESLSLSRVFVSEEENYLPWNLPADGDIPISNPTPHSVLESRSLGFSVLVWLSLG